MPHGPARLSETALARREDLIRGTIASIVRLGYHDSTVQTICDEAGLSRGLIGHYFKGKDDLLMEAFRYVTNQLGEETRRALAVAGPDPLQRLLAAVSVVFRPPVSQRDRAPVWVAFWGIARWRPEMLALHRKLWRGYRAWIQRLIAKAAAERGLQIDARRSAIAFTQLIDGLWIGWIMDDQAYEPEDAEAILRDWVLDLLHEPRDTPLPPSA